MTDNTGKRKTALLTGGSRGIGRAICLRLVQDGCDVIFSFKGNADAAKETVRLCEEAGGHVQMIKADVSRPEDCNLLIREALEFGEGRIDILVNNAGITKDNLLVGIRDEDLDAVLNVNLKGSFYMMRGVCKKMIRQRSGRIINMSSVVGLHGNAGQVSYAASKAAVVGMTKSLAKELASRHITVNAVAPGMIRTDMTDALSDSSREKIRALIPLAELGQPEDVAAVVSFLAGEGGRYITGQVISVDGGMGI